MFEIVLQITVKNKKTLTEDEVFAILHDMMVDIEKDWVKLDVKLNSVFIRG